MDFKSFVNKESFKAILLQHLKSQVKTNFLSTISEKVHDCLKREEPISSDFIVTSVSSSILDSEEFPEFRNSFLGSVNSLLEDEDKYVPKNTAYPSSSQCSSASSVNASSIDFLRPDQFQNVIHSLSNGTNAEKLESLGTLYRLPTLEHLTHHFSWSDVEKGLHNSLASDIIFLKVESLKLYVKMLSCSESKVVQESYLSLIKYFLQVLLPSLSQGSFNSDFITQCKSAVEIISILNKFLQNISTHWLRYPQSVIENITIQSLSILSPNCNNSCTFPIWMCIAMCDPEAKWLKSIMHGHVSRASLLDALGKDLDILYFAIGLCDEFYAEENCLILKEDCCKKSHLIDNLNHVICFLSHLLEYCEGRDILSCRPDEKYVSNWINVLEIVMNCAYKLCRNACFTCCTIICDTVSKKWNCLWGNGDSSVTADDLLRILASPLHSKDNDINLNTLYFTMKCFCESLESIHTIVSSSEFECEVNSLVFQLLDQCIHFYSNCDLTDEPSVIYLYNSSLVLVKKLLTVPSILFLNPGFILVLSEWWSKVKDLNGIKYSAGDLMVGKPCRQKVYSEVNKNILDVSTCLLRKSIGIIFCLNSSLFEVSLNILLEKILGDIKSRNSVCPCDVFVLSNALNSTISLKSALSKTIVLRLSSVIWQFNEASYDLMENVTPLKCVLDSLIPSIICDLASTEMMASIDLNSEISLFEYVLLFPNSVKESFASEDYNILALQVISLLSTSIHSICVLQAKFHITDFLLDLQSTHVCIDDKMVIDPISILQNHILVKLFVIGGPSEKNLPDEMLQNNNDSYDWPFVTEYPVQEVFYHLKNHETDHEEKINNQEFVGTDLKSNFSEFIQQNEKLPFYLVFQYLKQSIDTFSCDTNHPLNYITLDDANSKLNDEELNGILLVTRYGQKLNLVADNDEGKLEQLLKASKCLIGSEDSTKLDMFVCSIFLMCKGDTEIAWAFLQNFAKSSNSFFIWRELAIQVSYNCAEKSVTLPCIILEWCDIIIKKTFPLLFAAFEFRGILPSVIFNYWTLQCYWNYLDFVEISHFVLLNVLFSGEFALYFFASVLKHLYNFILQNAHSNDLYSLLIKNPIHGYKVCDYINFLNELSSTFHESLSKSVMEIL